MSTQETTRPKRIAEEIRRMSAKELAALVEALCVDNMGKKLETALSFENLDKSLKPGV